MIRANSFELIIPILAYVLVEITSLCGNIIFVDFEATTDYVIGLLVVDDGIIVACDRSMSRKFMAAAQVVVGRHASV